MIVYASRRAHPAGRAGCAAGAGLSGSAEHQATYESAGPWQRYRIAERLRRLNELGFDADEVELISAPDGTRLQVRTKVAESGQHSRWVREVYEPALAAVPADLRDRLAPPEIFDEILEHRWYLSEQAGLDVGTTMAAQSYVDNVLPQVPGPLTTSIEHLDGLPPGHRDLAADGVAEEA